MAKNGTNHQSYPLIDPKDLRFFLTVFVASLRVAHLLNMSNGYPLLMSHFYDFPFPFLPEGLKIMHS